MGMEPLPLNAVSKPLSLSSPAGICIHAPAASTGLALKAKISSEPARTSPPLQHPSGHGTQAALSVSLHTSSPSPRFASGMRETLRAAAAGNKTPSVCWSPLLHTYRSNPYGGHKSALIKGSHHRDAFHGEIRKLTLFMGQCRFSCWTLQSDPPKDTPGPTTDPGKFPGGTFHLLPGTETFCSAQDALCCTQAPQSSFMWS